MSSRQQVIHKNIVVIALFLVVLFNASYNLANFPAFFWDQGVYIQRGINFIQDSIVYDDPTYIDHPPLGWLIPSLIFKAIGFPGSITHHSSSAEAQQQIMLLFLVPRLVAIAFTMSVAGLIYKIAFIMYGNRNLAMVSLASFSIIPAIWPFRNMLLDPIMVTLVLLPLYLLISKTTSEENRILYRKKFWGRLMLSGFLFGMALLVKLTAIFFLPAILLFALGYGWPLRNKNGQATLSYSENTVSLQTTARQKAWFAILLMTPVLGCLASWIAFLATQHLLHSLVTTQVWQLSRPSFSFPGVALPLLLMTSPIGTAFGIFGLINTVLDRQKRVWASLGLPYLAFLFRGGYVGWVHAIPMLPLLSIYAAKPLLELTELVFYRLKGNQEKRVDPNKISHYLIIFVLVVSVAITIWLASFDEARSDREATQYLISNMPKNAILVTDPGYGWVIKIYRPDLDVINYYLLKKMDSAPSSFYIAEKSNPSRYDPTLLKLDDLYNKSCLVKTFENNPANNFFHPYAFVQDKWWNVEVRYYDVKGCTN